MATTPTTWTTRDGRELLITEMGTQHIVNTIALIRRNTEKFIVAGGGGGGLPLDAEWISSTRVKAYLPLVHELNRRAMRALANALTLFLDGTAVRGMQMELD
jgi:hypothetical protein